ncbi:bifunctional lysylphosphatidylglycerol flippase/synthetase MprF [Rhizobiaceae bacterium BDR2-2]|uniref:Bifunctional lysylphosphatidylglycerol flippase/synthetase MprF n=1 Tax=Ectorhizobium quercum TaxID=2965071 RepID=A0AAE3N785_9HYPH|nr:bifunctional lysylphosphatidylglycerol flippase/synthetase MprF [Ectorhizobium quercum]MCX8999857.1 bifunctional lysylphosphatidylglycerol flippase/synthetase MprF [Ectorhizobium quercum]
MADAHKVAAEYRASRVARLFLTYRLYILGTVSLVVFTLVAFGVYRLTAEVRYQDVLAALSNTSWVSIALAVLFTGLSFLALIFYDSNALDYIGRKLPFPSVAVTAFVAYAVGNTVGFGPLSGGAIRFRAYSRFGLSPGDVARVIAFVTLAFGLGLLSVSALATLVVAPRVAGILEIDAFWLRAIALLVLVALAGLLFVSRSGRSVGLGGLSLRLPDSRTSSRQFLVSACDIAASASVLYVLLPETHVGWPTFLAIYAVAIGFGVLSHVPAGLGVFEAVIMAGLSNVIGIDQLLGSLVLYRLIYYVLPLLLAIVLLLVVETRQLTMRPGFAEAAQLAGRLAPALISTLALVIGTMLIFSSVVPTPDTDLDFLSAYLPLPIVEAAHFLSSLLGLLLLVAARGLGQRLDGAWWVALAAACVAFAFAFLKAVAVFEAALLALFIVALLFNARAFDRHSSLLRHALGPMWLATIAVILIAAFIILLFVYRDTQYAHGLWWQFEFSEEAPRGLRALLGLAIAASAVALFSLLRPAHFRTQAPTPEDIERAVAITMRQDVADANLVRMGDKRLLFSPSGDAYIMYGIHGRSWIALGDPIGAKEEFPELVWQFVSAARAGGGRAAFYQISPALLSACTDVGLRAFKLGELALVDLSQFDLKSSRLANLRQSYNRGLRDGLAFSVVPAADVGAIVGDLRAISDRWLAHHNTKEKTFSLGAFDEAYVMSQPVAVVRLEGRIVAFATLMVTDTKAEATVDLMRFAPDAPKGAMDFLFVSMIEHLREAGYRQFNLGMAPLSGMARREAAPVWDRVGGTLFEHGERFYNFKGLRAFKSKFQPRWEPRYLAVSNGAGAALALMDVTFLIGGGVKGVISK